MPSKRIPKKKLACATKETKEGKQYTTCYEKKVTPARTFRVKKKVPVPEKKTSVKKPAAKSNGADIISQLRKKYPDQDFKLESRFGEKKYIVMGTSGRKVSAIVSDNMKEIGVVGKTSIADIMNQAENRNILYPAPAKKKAKKKPIKQVRQEEHEKRIEGYKTQIRKNQLEDSAKAEAKKAADPYNKTFKELPSSISARGKFGMYSKGGGRGGANAQYYQARGDDEVAMGEGGLSIFDQFPAAFKERLLRNPGEYQTINGKQFRYSAAVLPSARKAVLNRKLDENLAPAKKPAAAKKDPNALRYEKYLPPGMWKNLGSDFGEDDTKLQDYSKSVRKGKFDYYLENPWIPDKTPHPFAGQKRPKDHFDKFAEIGYAKYNSRKEYIEGEKKRIEKEKNPEAPLESHDSDYWRYLF